MNLGNINTEVVTDNDTNATWNLMWTTMHVCWLIYSSQTGFADFGKGVRLRFRWLISAEDNYVSRLSFYMVHLLLRDTMIRHLMST